MEGEWREDGGRVEGGGREDGGRLEGGTYVMAMGISPLIQVVVAMDTT